MSAQDFHEVLTRVPCSHKGCHETARYAGYIKGVPMYAACAIHSQSQHVPKESLEMIDPFGNVREVRIPRSVTFKRLDKVRRHSGGW